MLILRFKSGLVIIVMILSEWQYYHIIHMILGSTDGNLSPAQWLPKLGPSLWNISMLPMEFFDEGEVCVLRKPEILTLATATADHNTTLEDLFAKSRHLLFFKWDVDHKIYLKDKSNTLNLQHYKYGISQVNLGVYLIIPSDDDDVLESEELKEKFHIHEESCAHNGIANKGFGGKVYGPSTVQGIFGATAYPLELFPKFVILVMLIVPRLKLCTESGFISAHPLPKQLLLILRWADFVSILNRKMIDRGRKHVPLCLLKWKALPPKHRT